MVICTSEQQQLCTNQNPESQKKKNEKIILSLVHFKTQKQIFFLWSQTIIRVIYMIDVMKLCPLLKISSSNVLVCISNGIMSLSAMWHFLLFWLICTFHLVALKNIISVLWMAMNKNCMKENCIMYVWLISVD